MKKLGKFAISIIVAFVGTVLIASTVIKAAVALFMRPPDYGPTWYHWLVWVTMFGSLILSPLLFALCYAMLSRGIHFWPWLTKAGGRSSIPPAGSQ